MESAIKEKRFLTFNHHESYLSVLAKTGAKFDVVTRKHQLRLAWNESACPVPSNFRLIEWDLDLESRLRKGVYDGVVCHTLKNVVWLFPFRKTNRVIFVAHIPLFFYAPYLFMKSAIKKLMFVFFRRTMGIEFVAVSEFKRKMWFENGDVIVLAPRPIPEVPYTKEKKVIVVCNQLLDRHKELGAEGIFALAKKVPLQVIGNNPHVPFGVKPKNELEFARLFRSASVYLYTIKAPLGDGYNTAMLEAMSLAIPVVTLFNPSSPIVHGQNGLVAESFDELEGHIRRLLEDESYAQRLGEAGRETVKQLFNEEQFVKRWTQILMRQPQHKQLASQDNTSEG